MRRAAILPTPGDPFLLHYWLKLFDRVWRLEIDKLYVYVNGADKQVFEYIEDLYRRYAVVSYNPNQVEHGQAIATTLETVKETDVMLIEDDGLIFKPGHVANCFRQLENGTYDIVGSKRGSCGTQILKLAQNTWGLSYEGYGDQGPSFWPCYFFTHAYMLRGVDNYGAKFWAKGDIIKPFNVAAEYDQAGDTFVDASLQLRGVVAKERILTIPQYHLHPDDYDHYRSRQSIWDGQANWLHIGSLSSGYNNLLDVNKPLPARPANDFEKREYERRVQWWLTFWENREPGKLESRAAAYKLGIDRLITSFKLSRERIAERQRITQGVINYGF